MSGKKIKEFANNEHQILRSYDQYISELIKRDPFDPSNYIALSSVAVLSLRWMQAILALRYAIAADVTNANGWKAYITLLSCLGYKTKAEELSQILPTLNSPSDQSKSTFAVIKGVLLRNDLNGKSTTPESRSHATVHPGSTPVDLSKEKIAPEESQHETNSRIEKAGEKLTEKLLRQKMFAVEAAYGKDKFKVARKKAAQLIKSGLNHHKLFNIKAACEHHLRMGDQALKTVEIAIELQPNDPTYYYNKAVICRDLNKLQIAFEACDKAVLLKPNYPEAYNLLGILLKRCKEDFKAVAAFKRAVELNKSYADAYNNLGSALKDLREYDEAVKTVKVAIELEPRNPKYLNNLAINLRHNGRLEEAHVAIKKCIEISPKFSEAYSSLGNILKDLGDLSGAMYNHKAALKINPSSAKIHNNIGNVYLRRGDPVAAEKYFKRAYDLDNSLTVSLYNLSYAYFYMDRYLEGLHYYEWRMYQTPPVTMAPDPNKRWQAKLPVKNKTFLVYSEQGIGDTFQYVRYLTDLVSLGANVIFQVDKKLHKVLHRVSGKIKLVHKMDESIRVDYEVPLMSLPLVIKDYINLFAPHEGYLVADVEKVKSWRKKLNQDCLNIGICWQGSMNKIDIGRSFSLSYFERIAELENVRLVSLHKGMGESQLDQVTFAVTAFDENFDVGDSAFVDTAALIKACDIIITSDTAVAHLAGALGAKTFLALQYVPDSRWLLSGSTTKWYENMKLFRQTSKREWSEVFDSLLVEIRKHMLTKSLLEEK